MEVRMSTYTLRATEEQMVVVRDALDLAARCGMGQIHEAVRWFPAPHNARLYGRFFRLGLFLARLFGHVGITQAEQHCQIAWELMQVIRHRLAWDRVGNPPVRKWPDMMHVIYHEPLWLTKGPRPECRRDDAGSE
jgi:hypothetical protein